MKQVIFTVTNDIYTDQRINKMARTLHDMVFSILLVGVKRKDSLPFSPDYAKVKRIPLVFHEKFWFYAEYNLKLFFFLLFRKCDLLVANDLDTLLPVHLVSRIRRKPLVYDTHEYFTGSPEVASRPKIFRVWKRLENLLFPKQKTIITVNGSIAGLYEQEYSKKLHVVRNLPVYRRPDTDISRKSLGLPEEKKIILLQGSGINVDRGAEELLLSMLPHHGISNALLLIIGGGNVIDVLKQIVKEEGLEERVKFLPKMPYDKLLQYTAKADIGVSLDKDSSVNYRFSLPNKIFDYMVSGTPVLASDLPEVSAIIKKYNTGMIAQSHDPAHIAQCIKTMFEDETRLKQWRENCLKAARELCWEKEEPKVREIYKHFLK